MGENESMTMNKALLNILSSLLFSVLLMGLITLHSDNYRANNLGSSFTGIYL